MSIDGEPTRTILSRQTAGILLAAVLDLERRVNDTVVMLQLFRQVR